MLYSDSALSINLLDNGIAELCFDLQGESVNKFNHATVASLSAALDALTAQADVKGLLVTSAKPVFIVGADITEFTSLFNADPSQIAQFTGANNANFNRIEDLPYPSVVAINGFALGGGFEFCLACDFRIMSTAAKVGLPETKLGILPGWGGTVRLPRVVGVDVALEWITAAKDATGEAALSVGAVDAVAAPEQLRDAALAMLQDAIGGKLDYAARRQQKTSAMSINATEATMAFTSARGVVAKVAGRNYPAPLAVVDAVAAAHGMDRAGALAVECEAFTKLAQTSQARALVGVFLADQLMAKKAKNWEKSAGKKIERSGVLGAGIMGGGIAYQTAVKGTPVLMKDINQAGIDLGMTTATKLLSKRVSSGRMTADKMAQVLNNIHPTLNYDGFDCVDVCVEAVVENPKVKEIVLAETEKHIREDAVLASNTSTIRITGLAKALARPENFVGMHFFNPVHAMPLVEVIRGEQTSDETVARTVAYANKMGKKAVVIRDCPGFLVNRTLFPYFDGFSKLLRDGADFKDVDAVMEKWGWPMGPAYLLDVVGIDTCVHAAEVMAEGFPERMLLDFKTAIQIMGENERYGQKNGKGFYIYVADKRGRPAKTHCDESYALLAPHTADRKQFDEEEIIFRMMLPMATEMARCLEENIVDTVEEADLSLVYGLGMPPFRGGVFRWMDEVGMATVAEWCDKLSYLGQSYEMTDGMRALLESGKTYY